MRTVNEATNYQDILDSMESSLANILLGIKKCRKVELCDLDNFENRIEQSLADFEIAKEEVRKLDDDHEDE